MMNTRLAPIDKPRNWLVRLAYWLSKRQFGFVLTPLRIFYARLPSSFALWAGRIQKLDRKLVLSEELTLLIRILVAQRNTCHFCIDIARAKAMDRFAGVDKFWLVTYYAHSPLFTEKERAALAFADVLTQRRTVPDDVYAELAIHYTEREQIEVAWVVASEHVYNLMNVAFNIESDGLCRQPAAVVNHQRSESV